MWVCVCMCVYILVYSYAWIYLYMYQGSNREISNMAEKRQGGKIKNNNCIWGKTWQLSDFVPLGKILYSLEDPPFYIKMEIVFTVAKLYWIVIICQVVFWLLSMFNLFSNHTPNYEMGAINYIHSGLRKNTMKITIKQA